MMEKNHEDNNQHEQQIKRTDFMAQVVGKYRLVGQVNYEEFLRAIGKLLLALLVHLSLIHI